MDVQHPGPFLFIDDSPQRGLRYGPHSPKKTNKRPLKKTYYGVFTTSKHSIWVPENMFLKLFAGYSFKEKKSCLPLFPSVSVPSECAVSGVCSFHANELLPIDQWIQLYLKFAKDRGIIPVWKPLRHGQNYYVEDRMRQITMFKK